MAEGGDSKSSVTVVVVKGMFGKGTELSPFLGLKVVLREVDAPDRAVGMDGGGRSGGTAAASGGGGDGGGSRHKGGAVGVIEGGFGKSGKVRIRFRVANIAVSPGDRVEMPFVKLVFGDTAARGGMK